MRGSYSLGWRYIKERKGRAALTTAGIALGVALVVGVLIANRSTARTFDSLIQGVTGTADVLLRPIGSVDSTLPDGTALRVAKMDDVEDVEPSYSLDVDLEDNQIWLEGVDGRTDARFRGWDLLDGSLPRPGRDEIVISEQHAKSPQQTLFRQKPGPERLSVGDRLTAKSSTQSRRLTISGIVTYTGVGGRANGASVIVLPRVLTSPDVARNLGAETGDNTIALKVSRNIDPEVWVERHRAELAGLDTTTTRAAQEDFKRLLELFLASLTWVASISLFIAGFLIYLTLSRSVIERSRVHGIMRAVGASPRHVRTAVLTEALGLGLVASVIGVALGLGVAAVVTSLLARLGFPVVRLTIDSRALIAGPVLGLGTTLLSAVLPSRRASRTNPAVAIRGRLGMETELSRVWILGAVLVLVGVTASLTIGSTENVQFALIYLITASVLLGSVLLVPPLLRPLAWLLGLVTARIARGTGDVSVRHLVRERSRSAYTLALIMLVLAALFTFGAVDTSMGKAVDEVFDAQYGLPDLLVRPNKGVLPASAEGRVQRLAGVEETTPVSFINARLVEGERDIDVYVIDPSTYFDLAGFSWVAGDELSARRDLRPGAVLLSEGAARRASIHRGDPVSFYTSSGTQRFTVAGTVQSLLGLDAVMTMSDAKRFLNADRPGGLLVKVERASQTTAVRRSLHEEFRREGVTAMTMSRLRHDLERFGVRDLMRIFLVILGVAAVIGLLGLANTLTMSVTERIREIGVMRATGASRGQLWRMVICEGATLGLAAYVLAIPLGWLLTSLVVRGASLEGLPVRITFPATWVPTLAIIAVVVAVVASIGPAWRAGRFRPAEALRFE